MSSRHSDTLTYDDVTKDVQFAQNILKDRKKMHIGFKCIILQHSGQQYVSATHAGHLQGDENENRTNIIKIVCKLHHRFKNNGLLNPEEGTDRLSRNVRKNSPLFAA